MSGVKTSQQTLVLQAISAQRRALKKRQLELQRLAEEATSIRKNNLEIYEQQAIELAVAIAQARSTKQLIQQLGDEQLSDQLGANQDYLTRMEEDFSQLSTTIKQLRPKAFVSKEEAKQSKKAYLQQLEKQQIAASHTINTEGKQAALVQQEVNALVRATANMRTQLKKNSQELAKKIQTYQKLEIQYQTIEAELAFIGSNESLNLAAFTHYQAMRDQGYILRQTMSGDELTAWFEHQENPIGVEVKLREAANEGAEWCEELSLFGPNDDDECQNQAEDIWDTLANYGVQYSNLRIRYPRPDGNAPQWVSAKARQIWEEEQQAERYRLGQQRKRKEKN